MNPRITDLLDDYVDTSVRLLPPEQVLRGKAPGNTPSPAPKPARHRMKKPLVIAAALLLMLTGVAASVLTMSRGGSFGSSLSGGLSEAPSTAQWASQESAFSSSESVPDELILDDTNSVIVTSEATGLSMRVPTEYQDGLKTDNSLDLEDSLGGTYHWDGVFTFYDTSNQDGYYGIVFNMEAWEQSTYDSYLSDSLMGYTFTLNSAVVGTDGTTYYSMLQFGNPITNEFPNFNASNLDSARAYYERLKYAIPMVNSFIELNGLNPVETGLSGWDELFRQRMLEPMEELIGQLENETPQQDTQEPEEAATYAELDLSPAEDIHSALPSGDASSVDAATTTLTSSTGLSINVMSECMDAGEFYVDETITLEKELSCNIDVVFAAYDQRNLDSGGFLWAIVDGSPESMPLDLPDGYRWDVMGQLDGETYSIIMPTADNLQFNASSLADATSYNNHVLAMQWNLSEVIRDVTNYTPDADGTQDWEPDYVKLVSDPVYQRLTELERARQNSLQPSDSSLNLPAAEDVDGDGLLTAELNISVETEYGTAILQKFTLDPSSLEFSWYTDLSGLSGPFAEYGSDLSAAMKEHADFNAQLASVFNSVQEVILDSMLVYPDKSHICLSTGEKNDYGTQSRSYDTLGLATQYPTSAEHPSCLEIGGVTYSLS